MRRPRSRTYPDSVIDRHQYLHQVIADHRVQEQEVRRELALAMRRAVDRREVSASQMARDMKISRWRAYQLMEHSKNGDRSAGDEPDQDG